MLIAAVSLFALAGVAAAEEAQSAPRPDWPAPVDDRRWYDSFVLDPLEYQLRDGEESFRWEGDGWVGGDYERLWLKTEGELTDDEGEAEAQLLYARLIAPFWDLQLGARYDQPWGPGAEDARVFAVIGVEGLAPHRFDVEPALFLSEDADVSARLTATVDLLVTQRLVLQPRFELNAAAQEVRQYGIGRGLNDFELGLRLRYELLRELAPYTGVSWTRKTGETAGIVREDGGETSDFAVVFGVRLTR